ncbi:MAG: Lipolytic enzyme, G-D-S-L [uncultured bacterium]|nr:MAG: Lipolytic enzyme, G-D-S-L [uncultured bacterium]
MNIIFFGDSICFGQGISLHSGWVCKISKAIDKYSKKNKRKITVINSSINGNTTRQALERMSYDVQSHAASVIIVQFGMNDCNYWQTDHGLPRVSPEAFKANLSEIVDRAVHFGAMKIFVNTNHPTEKNEKIPYGSVSYQESNAIYNEGIRKLASEKKMVDLNDIEKHFYGEIKKTKTSIKDYLLEDGIHLNLAGHNLYYNLVCPSLIKALKKIKYS